MKKRLTGALLAAVLIVGLFPAAAQATKPLDVDCEQLWQTDVVFFAVAPLSFKSLGDLISFFQRDDAAFAEASTAFGDISEFVVGGPRIEFESMSQSVSTHSKCGLTPGVIGLIGGG